MPRGDFASLGGRICPILISFASFTFLAPAWAVGFLAVALPWLAHLLSRGGHRPAPFPAARFVRQARAETRHLLRPRHYALLALRTSALALIVLAFMQPVWRAPVPTAGADDAERALGRHVVLIVDRTASMQRADRGHTLFERARRRAVAMLQELNPTRDRASIVALDRHPQPLLPEPTANFASLIERLEHLAPTHEHGRADEALRRARALHQRLDASERRPLHIEMFTDAQHTQWPNGEITAPALDHATLRVHRLGGFWANDALHDPAVLPRQPIVGQPATVTVRATRFGDDAGERTIEMRLGDQRQTRHVRLEPFTERTVDFTVTFTDPGPAVIELRFATGDDALPTDDTTGRIVHVSASRSVHLFTRADTDDPDRAAFFVQRALSPRADDTAVSLATHAPEALSAVADGIGDERAASGVLALVEAGNLSLDELRAMRAHVRAGGGAIWVIDSPEAAAALRRFDQTFDEAPIMPRTSNANDAWQADQPRALGTARFDDPIISAFEGATRTALLRQRFTATLRSELQTDSAALLRFEDGEPALAVRDIGAGRLAVLGADLDPATTDLARGPTLVPLLHQLLRHLAPGAPAPPNPHPGDEADGTRIDQPGLHARVDPESGALLDGVWCEIDPRQSDLRAAAMHSVNGADGLNRTVMVGGPSAGDDIAGRGSRDVALWPWLMLAALLALLIEPAMLLWMRGGRDGAIDAAGGD